jgi:hypothetical protein
MNSVQQPIEIQAKQSKRSELIPRLYVAIGIILVLVLAILFILAIVWLAQNHATTIAALRNLMIIALALMSCIFGIVLLVMFVVVVRLVNMLEFEIKPILEKTNETLGTVQGTTNFVSENVVRPVTRASSNLAGFRRGLATLFGNPKNNLPD